MELNKLYEIANKEHIKLYNEQIKDIKGLYINYNNINAINLNFKEIKNEIDEKCTLAEELGHYFYDATYSLNSDIQNIERQEFRAKKWRFKTIVPPHQLKKLFEKGYSYSFEMAEELGVTEDIVRSAYEYYRENNLIDCY